MWTYFYLFMYMYIIGLWTLCSKRKHMFLYLLSLEFIILSLFFVNLFNYEFYFGMICLCFSVCEGVLGLSVLVMVMII